MKPSIVMTRVVPLVAVLLAACHPKDKPQHVEETPPQGREETRGIRNTEAIGYSGKAIADKVDGALNANDQAKQRIDDAEARATE